MKDIGVKMGKAAIGVAAAVGIVMLTGSAVALVKHAAHVLKDDSWTKIALMTGGSIAATVILFKVQWWIMDKLVAYSKKVIASICR
jgi:hypothetical protein